MMSNFSELISDMKKASVRRCLFGPPDREKQRAHLDAQENTLQETDTKRFQDVWGINPDTGVPVVGGKYECTLVDPTDTSVPNFYRRGYPSSRKSRPVRAMHERSPVDVYNQMVGSGRLTSAKRKLALDNDDELHENNENLDHGLPECRVLDKGECKDVSREREPFGLSSSAPIPMMNFDSHSCSEFGLTRSSSTSSLPGLSPAPRIDPEITPPTRPKSLTQSSIKDYLPLKKQRCIAKALPRT